MTLEAKLWLPKCSKAETHTAIFEQIDRWAKQWFGADHGIRATATQKTDARRIKWDGTQEARFGCESGGAGKLGLAAIGLRGDLDNGHDARVLEQLGDLLCRDLVARFRIKDEVVEFVTGLHEDPSSPRECFLVAPEDRSWTMFLVLGPQAIIMARRCGKGENRPVPTLGTLGQALASELCSVAGHLGTASLNAGEVATLAKGDVVMLDRIVGEDIPLVVNGLFPAEGSARIEGSANALRIDIAQPISLKAGV